MFGLRNFYLQVDLGGAGRGRRYSGLHVHTFDFDQLLLFWEMVSLALLIRSFRPEIIWREWFECFGKTLFNSGEGIAWSRGLVCFCLR